MSKVISKVRQGRVEFIAPSDWPEGCNVESSQVTSTNNDELMSKEEIEQTLKARDEYFSQVFDIATVKELEVSINDIPTKQ